MSSAADYYGAANAPQTANYGPPAVDFSWLAGLGDQFYKGRQQGRAEDQAQAFRNGIPRDPQGNFDITKTTDILARNNPSLAMPLLQMQLQNQYGAQDAAASQAASDAAHGGGPPSAQPQGQQQPTATPAQAQPAPDTESAPPRGKAGTKSPTIMRILEAQGIPNDQWEAAGASLSRQLGVGVTDPLDTNDPQVRNVLVPALQRLKGVGQVQPAQAGDESGGPMPGAAVAAPAQVGMTAMPQGVAPGSAPGQAPDFAARFSAASPQGVPSAVQAPQQVAQAQQAPQAAQQSPVDTDPANQARLARADNLTRAADGLQQRAIANSIRNPKAAEGMQKQVDSLRAEAKSERDAVNSDVARTEQMKNADASGQASPLKAATATKEMEGEVARSDKTYSGIQGAASQFDRDLKPYLDISRGILNKPGMYTGMGGDWSLTVNRAKAMFGDQKAAQLQEALSKVTASSVLSQINTQKDQMMEAGSNSGRIFAQQVALVEKAAPAQGTTLGGNRFLINVADRMGNFSTEMAKQARSYIAAHGHLDPKFDQQMSDYLEKHPIFTRVELDHPDSLSAPDAPSDIKTTKEMHAWAQSVGLKKGDPIRMPGGVYKAAP